MADTAIRWATPDDAETIVALIQALARYENEPVESVKMTPALVRRDGFGATPRFECLLAELHGEVVGIGLFFHTYSTWEGRAGLYVEDLFVKEEARGHGLGQALMASLAAIARARDCPRLDLSVIEWNPTRDFYHRLNMRHLTAWLPYRMDQDAIAALADTAPPIAPSRG